MLDLNENKKLSNHEIDILNDCLKEANKDSAVRGGMCWADGYLCAINSSPTLLAPSECLYSLIDEEHKFEEKQGFLIIELCISFYNNVNKDICSNSYVPIYERHRFKEETKLKSAINWSTGYMFGIMVACEKLLAKEEFCHILLPAIILTGVASKRVLKKCNISLEETVDKIPLMIEQIAEFYD